MFLLKRYPLPWIGGEPRVFAVAKEDNFPNGLDSIKDAKLVDARYQGGGLTDLLDNIAALCNVPTGSFQAILENLELISKKSPLVIVVRDADNLLRDAGPAVIHLMAAWEGFARHSSGINDMYLVLETGPRQVINSAFYPGGIVNWPCR